MSQCIEELSEQPFHDKTWSLFIFHAVICCAHVSNILDIIRQAVSKNGTDSQIKPVRVSQNVSQIVDITIQGIPKNGTDSQVEVR